VGRALCLFVDLVLWLLEEEDRSDETRRAGNGSIGMFGRKARVEDEVASNVTKVKSKESVE